MRSKAELDHGKKTVYVIERACKRAQRQACNHTRSITIYMKGGMRVAGTPLFRT